MERVRCSFIAVIRLLFGDKDNEIRHNVTRAAKLRIETYMEYYIYGLLPDRKDLTFDNSLNNEGL
jgi:hypothetical protein